MRYLALATDYDGTIAHHGRVDEPTLAALRRLRESGRKLLLVTGRELPELAHVFPHLDLFDRVVAENGALLYRPETREERLLAEPANAGFVAELKERGVGPISVGRCIVATWEPHETTVLDAIRRRGLELQVTFNKGAVMVLPSGVNKATGLAAALDELGLSPHNCVAVGDAENDHAMLALCEAGVAVANALPAVKERADMVTASDHGAGVSQLIDRLVADDLADLAPKLTRHAILLGEREGGREFLDPYGRAVLVAGTSGSGKSTLTTGILERLAEAGYQYAIIDPEGDYATLDGAVVLGDVHRAPSPDEVIDLLSGPGRHAVVNLLGVPLEQRPGWFASLLPRLTELRARTGRPHWLVVDEAHHLLPTDWRPAPQTLPAEVRGVLFITVHPESVARPLLGAVDVVLAVGQHPERTLADFCAVAGHPDPKVQATALEAGETLVWRPDGTGAVKVRSEPPKTVRRRHSRKYAEGNLGADRSFHFRGPDGRLNLRAQNLVLFLQLADGVDDATWEYHLRQGDYSGWFREAIKDSALAEEIAAVEADESLPPAESRSAVRARVEARYTLPADRPSGLVDAAG